MANDFWSIVAIMGLLGWVASTIVFVFRAFPERNRFEAGAARVWGAAVVASFSIWIAGLLNA